MEITKSMVRYFTLMSSPFFYYYFGYFYLNLFSMISSTRGADFLTRPNTNHSDHPTTQHRYAHLKYHLDTTHLRTQSPPHNEDDDYPQIVYSPKFATTADYAT